MSSNRLQRLLMTCLALGSLKLGALPLLQSPHEVLALSNDDSARHFPVHMRAIVTLYDAERYLFFLQTDDEAIYATVHAEAPLNIRPGDLVEVEGTTERGGYSPVIDPTSVRVVGHPGVPTPRRMSAQDLSDGRYENIFGESSGRIISARIGRGIHDEPTQALFELDAGSVIAHGSAKLSDLQALKGLLNAEVLIRGIFGSECNGQGRRRASQIMLDGATDITVVRRHEIDWDSVPSEQVANLLRYRGMKDGVRLTSPRRVRITGVLTYFDGGQRFYLQDGDTGLAVDSALPVTYRVGTTLEALGDLEWERWGSLHLSGAVFRTATPRTAPRPVIATADDLDTGEHESGLLAVTGQVLDQRHLPHSKDIIVLSDPSGFVFTAELPAGANAQLLERCQIGDTVRTTGVLDLDWPLGSKHIQARRILMRSPSDVQVIARLPWTAHVPWVRVVVVGVASIAAALLWVYLLRKRVRTQTGRLAAQSVALQAAMEAAQSANRAKSDFLANMSHEIRTPLNGVLGMTELALLDAHAPEQRDNLETALGSARSLLNVLNDILDFSKIESRKLEIEALPFSLRDIAKAILRTTGPRAAEKGVVQQLSIGEDVPEFVTGDPYRLQQVLLNLVSNGIKFTSQGSVSLCISRASEDKVTFEIADTGIGIPQDKQQLLFQPFTQADVSTTRKFGGSGLGLAISAQLVQLMQGNIHCESEAGKGSKFRFTIPLPKVTDAGVLTEAQRSLATGSQNCRVLVVEDHPVNQKLIERLLEKRGHRVTTAVNGREAVALAASQDFDVILMDVQMPEMDGYEATRRIRANHVPYARRVPILALTANVMKSDQEACLDAGMDGFLPKPVSAETLWDAIDTYAIHSTEKLEPAYTDTPANSWR